MKSLHLLVSLIIGSSAMGAEPPPELPEQAEILYHLVWKGCYGSIVGHGLVLMAGHCVEANELYTSIAYFSSREDAIHHPLSLKKAFIRRIIRTAKPSICAGEHAVTEIDADTVRPFFEWNTVCYAKYDLVFLVIEGNPFRDDQILDLGTNVVENESLWSLLYSIPKAEMDENQAHAYNRLRPLKAIFAPSSFQETSFQLKCIPDPQNDLFIGCLPKRGNSGTPILRKMGDRYSVVGAISGLSTDYAAIPDGSRLASVFHQLLTIFSWQEYQRVDNASRNNVDGTLPTYPFAIDAAWVSPEVISQWQQLTQAEQSDTPAQRLKNESQIR